jgi:hypothetical protein
LKAFQKIHDRAIESRDVGNITKRGNIDGFRFLLSQLYQHGYVDFPENDNEHYYVIKRADDEATANLLKALERINHFYRLLNK